MINRHESQLLAKERSNRLARQSPGFASAPAEQRAHGLPSRSANDEQVGPAKKR